MPTVADLARATERVFPTHARVDRYYPAAAAEEARGVLGRCLERGEGPALLIGAPGTGKSMLLNVLAGDLGSNRPVVCLTSAQLCTRRALLQSILFELGQPYRQRDEGDLRLALMDYFSSGDVTTTGMLLLVDEAQALPIRLLEELRILGNVSHQGVPVVRLLLAGSAPLEETFTEPAVEAFNQRIAARCYLSPLSHHETAQMVRGHLAAAGVNPDEMFTADALDAVYRATDGIARLVNQVCDRALVLAADHGKLQVGKQCVEGAWADLQQLPTPWNLPDEVEFPQSEQAEQDVVEFGPLSDDDSDYLPVVSAEQVSATPAARLHQPESALEETIDEEIPAPEVDLAGEPSATDIEYESTNWEDVRAGDAEGTSDQEPAEDVARTQPMPSSSLTTAPNARSEAAEKVVTPSIDDLFGGEFEEEIVINEYASFEQAIPRERPRVSSECEAEISQLLHDVIRTSGTCDEAEPTTEQPLATVEPESVVSETVDDEPFAGLSLMEVDGVENSGPELDYDDFGEEQLIDPTELDDETEDELYDQLTSMADEAQRATLQEERTLSTEEESADAPELIVVDDDMSLPIHTAAAHRADYRQLFKNLRED